MGNISFVFMLFSAKNSKKHHEIQLFGVIVILMICKIHLLVFILLKICHTCPNVARFWNWYIVREKNHNICMIFAYFAVFPKWMKSTFRGPLFFSLVQISKNRKCQDITLGGQTRSNPFLINRVTIFSRHSPQKTGLN